MSAAAGRRAEPVPVGTRLVHIGPHKTGTTSLQEALHAQRDDLEAHGVHYAGRRRHSRIAAAVATEGRLPAHDASAAEKWTSLVDEVRDSTADRVLISSEGFSNGDDESVARIVDAFGPEVHVVATVRPLAALLPSQWQQNVQTGIVDPYESWLRGVLAQPPTGPHSRYFWRRHRHDELARRWAQSAGPDRVTVVVLREGDLTMNLRVFEALLDLPDGLLRPAVRDNRGLSLAETELLRELNRQYREAGWPERLHDRLVRFGVANRLKSRTPAADEPRIATPRWALERAAQEQEHVIAGLRGSGVRVVGDLEDLRVAVPPDAPETASEVDEVALDLAAHAVLGTLAVTVLDPKPAARRARTVPATASAPGTRELARELAGRLRSHLPGRP